MTSELRHAYNRGVASTTAFAAALADDIRAQLADDPERYRAAVAALEVVLEAAPRLMLPVPAEGDVAGELEAIIQEHRKDVF